jgi:NAD-dependent dihydropyrimidine dehydrogenase PreA subunit
MLVVNEELCVGCGQCVPYCPQGALQVWGVAEVKQEECTQCLECIEYCPVDALEVIEDEARKL